MDEPVSALDVSIRGQIMNLLKDLQNKYKIAYLFISHDIASIAFLSTRIAVMYFGYIIEYSDKDTILKNYCHPYTEMLIQSNEMTDLDIEEKLNITDIPSHLSPPKGCPYAARCKYATSICKECVPVLRMIEEGHYVACHNR